MRVRRAVEHWGDDELQAARRTGRGGRRRCSTRSARPVATRSTSDVHVPGVPAEVVREQIERLGRRRPARRPGRSRVRVGCPGRRKSPGRCVDVRGARVKTYKELYIGGEWVAPAGSEVIEVISPATEEVIGQVPDGTPGRHRRRGRRGAPGVRRRPVAAHDAGAAGRGARRVLARRCRRAPVTSPTRSPRRTVRRSSGRSWARCSRRRWCSTPTPRLATEYEWVDTRAGMMGGPVRVRKAPVGVAAAITPWNVPLFIAALKLGPAMLDRLHRRAEARARDAARQLPARRGRDRGGRPRGRHQHRSRRARDR